MNDAHEITAEQAEQYLAARDKRTAASAAKSVSVGWRMFICNAFSDIERAVQAEIDEIFLCGRISAADADDVQARIGGVIARTMRAALASERAIDDNDQQTEGDNGECAAT